MYGKGRGPRPYTEAGLWTACEHHLRIKMFSQSTEPIERRHRCGGARTLFPEHDDKQGEVRFRNEMSEHDVPMMTSAFPSAKLMLISTAQDFFLPAGARSRRRELRGQIDIHVVIEPLQLHACTQLGAQRGLVVVYGDPNADVAGEETVVGSVAAVVTNSANVV